MIRKTEQREAIRRVLEQAKRPLNAQEVLDEAQSKVAGLGIATVYRNLKALTKEGWLKTVDLPGDASRYELADIAHHHHFHCTQCGRVFDLHGCTGNIDRLLPDGFKPDRHEILVYGQCADCPDEA